MFTYSFNPFSDKNPFRPTPAGSAVAPEYIGITLASGARIRQKVGEHSIQDFIQSFLDDCLIENILKRCELTGEPLRPAPAGSYIDTIGLPRSFADVQNAIAQARSVYRTLPADVLKRYPTFESFSSVVVSDSESPDFKELLGFLGMTPAAPAAPAAPAVPEGGTTNE